MVYLQKLSKLELEELAISNNVDTRENMTVKEMRNILENVVSKNCSICKQKVTKQKTLKCNHAVHYKCLKSAECPTCGQNIYSYLPYSVKCTLGRMSKMKDYIEKI